MPDKVLTTIVVAIALLGLWAGQSYGTWAAVAVIALCTLFAVLIWVIRLQVTTQQRILADRRHEREHVTARHNETMRTIRVLTAQQQKTIRLAIRQGWQLQSGNRAVLPGPQGKIIDAEVVSPEEAQYWRELEQ